MGEILVGTDKAYFELQQGHLNHLVNVVYNIGLLNKAINTTNSVLEVAEGQLEAARIARSDARIAHMERTVAAERVRLAGYQAGLTRENGLLDLDKATILSLLPTLSAQGIRRLYEDYPEFRTVVNAAQMRELGYFVE